MVRALSTFLGLTWLSFLTAKPCHLIEIMHSGTANNAGAILVVGRGLVIVPKLIHPLPPPLQSPETSPERFVDDAWMQVTFSLAKCFLSFHSLHPSFVFRFLFYGKVPFPMF